MPQDAEREKFIDPGPAFVLYESSYIVRPGSTIRNAAEVDRAGQKVGAVETAADFLKRRAENAQPYDLHEVLASVRDHAPDPGDERPPEA